MEIPHQMAEDSENGAWTEVSYRRIKKRRQDYSPQPRGDEHFTGHNDYRPHRYGPTYASANRANQRDPPHRDYGFRPRGYEGPTGRNNYQPHRYGRTYTSANRANQRVPPHRDYGFQPGRYEGSTGRNNYQPRWQGHTYSSANRPDRRGPPAQRHDRRDSPGEGGDNGGQQRYGFTSVGRQGDRDVNGPLSTDLDFSAKTRVVYRIIKAEHHRRNVSTPEPPTSIAKI